MKGFLSPNTMFKLEDLFKHKNWEIDSSGDARKSLYRRYCERLKYLDEVEQAFFIELSYRFEHIGIAEYLECFLMSLHDVNEELFQSKSKIIFSPLTKPFIKNNGGKEVERAKIKSAQFLFYLLNSHDLRWFDYSSKFEFYESIKEVRENYIENDTLLFLFDDFVGTGATAINCINEIKNVINSNGIIAENKDICVVCLAALKEGVEKVYSDLGIRVFSNIVREKGISDFYTPDELKIKLNLMLNIENKLNCPPSYSLGFGKSEALISFMDKPPNNTFPAYWHETSVKPAPFPRFKNYK